MTAAPCTCVENFDRRLAQHNTRIRMGLFRFGDGSWETRPTIASEQIETGRGKKKAATIAPNFCPFCGVPYAPEAVPQWGPIDQAPRDGKLVHLADEQGSRAVAMWVDELGWAWSFGEGEEPRAIDFVPTRFRHLPEEERG